MRGFFITFEGPEGSGKSTMINLLYKVLIKKGIETVKTFEPGDTRMGEKLRELLLSSHYGLSIETELLLYLADRSEHVKDVIIPALRGSKIVLCDRYSDSTIAYQVFGRGIDRGLVISIDNFARKGIVPDMTILLDIDVKKGLERKTKQAEHNRFESEDIEFHERVRSGYLQLAQEEPERIRVVDSDRPLEDVFKEVSNLVLNLISG